MHAAKLASTPKAVHRVDKTVSPVQVIPRNSCTQAATQILPVFTCVRGQSLQDDDPHDQQLVSSC